MAKRRRLSAFGITDDAAPHPDATAQRVPPVARIAGDAATQSALEDLAHEMRQAREDGRMVVELPLEAVEAQHLTRDRLAFDPEDMEALVASIRDRGQQTPIEVVQLDKGRYGLISGARRLAALRQLHGDSQTQFARVKALLRPLSTAPDAYLAMVEENEIRSDLSFYERGRLAHEAARLGVFDSPAAAVKALFVHVSASKRSKILNFVALHEALGDALRFPEAIPEKLGLPLVKAIERDDTLARRIVDQLSQANPQSPAEERILLDKALAPLGQAKPEALNVIDQPAGREVRVVGRPGRISLSGKGVTEALVTDLITWLDAYAGE
ncbi:ParB/RepB/Spo0J family partition protein [Paracoccus beibuensis]|uniref:ParB/RepB/Spo0J family partition protein n=1 Tax=Paracoccus beibuensis TaxID=547602 RepID=UPI002240281D|nr:ParB N-terminal domain-containing protein [Paracoccus beibuensis]